MINLATFNNKLIQLNSLYEELVSCTKEISSLNQNQLLFYVRMLDQNHKGYLTKNDLIEAQEKNLKFNMQKSSISNSKKRQVNKQQIRKMQIFQEYLNYKFPSERIAYLSIIADIRLNQEETIKTQRISGQDSKFFVNQKEKQYDIIKILSLSGQIYSLIPQILENIPKFIPLTSKNLTVQQMNNYVVSQKLKLQAQTLVNILNFNLFDPSLKCSNELTHQFYIQTNIKKSISQRNFDKEDKVLAQLQSITERLLNRVQNFGKQWFIKQRKSQIK